MKKESSPIETAVLELIPKVTRCSFQFLSFLDRTKSNDTSANWTNNLMKGGGAI